MSVDKKLTHMLDDESENEEITRDNEEISNLEQSVSKQQPLEELNLSHEIVRESPFKLYGIAPHSKSSYAKRKLELVTSRIKSKVSKVVEKEFTPADECSCLMLTKENEEKVKHMDRLI
ncbi:hypothetical protein J6590_095908 [Homalodisca vitripennis]|nr:hypothetical protein J6590_095908 [Homalodisca vitripennis]